MHRHCRKEERFNLSSKLVNQDLGSLDVPRTLWHSSSSEIDSPDTSAPNFLMLQPSLTNASGYGGFIILAKSGENSRTRIIWGSPAGRRIFIVHSVEESTMAYRVSYLGSKVDNFG